MEGLVIITVLAAFLFGIGRWIWYRDRSKAILSKHTGENPSLAEIQAHLNAVNAKCTTLTFYVHRCAVVRFRNHSVTLAFGPVYSNAFGGYGHELDNDALFAVADVSEIPWYHANADAFKPAFIGSRYSIFWPSVSELEAALLKPERNS